MADFNSGQRLSARYTLRQRLSAGALGETWQAHDATRDREVVIRFLPAAIATDASRLDCIAAELQTAQDVDPRVVAAAEALERDGEQPFLVREFVPGSDASTLRGESWRKIVSAAAQVARALSALHGKGIAHLDVKPSNVILRPDGTATLIDLGCAALIGAESNAGLSRYNASPQQLMGEPTSPADDAYGLGALLYELLSGYPPFYPNFSRERVLNEAVAVPQPARPVPPALLELATSLLAKSPAERPDDLGQVAQRLEELEQLPQDVIASAADTATNEPVATIVRPILRQGPLESKGRGLSLSARPRNWLVPAAFVVLVILAVSVFLVLPEVAQKAPRTASGVKPETTSTSKLTEAAPPEVDLRALAEQMEVAEQARGAYEALFASLEQRAAAEWAPQLFTAARKHGEEGRTQFEARQFQAARDSYAAGLGQLLQAAKLAGSARDAQLAKGQAALVSGQATIAQAAFALALKIEPNNAVADKGLKRAAVLDQVVALLTSAANQEHAGQLQGAAQQYQEALKLDPDTTSARDGVARVQARISGDQFAAAMSQGLGQLASGHLDQARNSLQRAKALRPGAREVDEALAQVAQAELRIRVAGLREKAEQLERAERWSAAQKEYDAALKLDPALEFARAGHDRAAPRAELAAQFEALITQPERMLSAAVRDQARALVAEARKIATPGPVLSRQIESVDASLASFDAPVRVALESDSQTDVVVHRYGRLGVFDHREIELKPGTYTVMGTRVGFRDVRRELTVLPGQKPAPLVVRCEDPI